MALCPVGIFGILLTICWLQFQIFHQTMKRFLLSYLKNLSKGSSSSNLGFHLLNNSKSSFSFLFYLFQLRFLFVEWFQIQFFSFLFNLYKFSVSSYLSVGWLVVRLGYVLVCCWIGSNLNKLEFLTSSYLNIRKVNEPHCIAKSLLKE
jgi:hypothetical protein